MVLMAIACCAASVWGDTLHLKDKAALTGRILAEKPDQVALDIGYTVLVVPREQVLSITRGDGPQLVKDGDATAGSDAPGSKLYATLSQTRPAGSVRELANRLGEAVVQVRTPAGLGSGFFINEEGFLITNFHVIEGETQISVEVYHLDRGDLEPKSYRQVRILAVNKFADLALLRIEDKGAPGFKHVPLGRSDSLSVGERVFAIGSPLGLERTVTEGILSTKTRQMGGELYLQTTAQINPGNSGGPLFGMSGEVVGVTNMKVTFGEGIGFAIPVEAVRFFLDHRDAFAYSNENPASAYRYLEPPSRARHAPSTVE